MTSSISDGTNSNSTWLIEGKRVVLQGLKAASHLNGKKGVVIRDPIIEAAGRYKIQLSSSSLSDDDGEGNKGGAIAMSVKPVNLVPLDLPQGAAAEDADMDAAAAEPLALTAQSAAAAPRQKKYRPKVYMSARPGAYKASYDWRAVLPGQPIPRGMEVIMALTSSSKDGEGDNRAAGGNNSDNNSQDDEVQPTLARIPRAWKLDVRVRLQVGTGTSSYDMVRCEVERTTTMADVKTAVLAGMRQKKLVGNDANTNTILVPVLLFVDDEPWGGTDDETVETAMLFGKQVSCQYKKV
ncbi:expressed unknown protein [Seminavis robusta]|uniref:Uncharacterized protein n=1 Tax=Seminavis robusta TaxID=568900 RepID=A0A9N8H077_9STRA|nr:expressed unknown protein [Seminavis robusta]|eukprot:Sro16_g011510.1 n/a (295) ;mRNA; r:13131-14015